MRFEIAVKNWADYPDVLFTPMPDLPPCGFNAAPTRMQVIVWSDDGRQLFTYCSVPHRRILQRLRVMLRARGRATRQRVYVTIEDRFTQLTWKSNVVPLVPPAADAP